MSKQVAVAYSPLERWVPAVVTAVVFIVASQLSRPVALPDESASLAAARYLAGLGSQSQWWFQPGYGFLLAPVLWLTQDLTMVMVGVHFINAALAGSVAAALVRLDRILSPESSPGRRAVAVLLVSGYPAYLYFAGQALSDNLLTAMIVWSTVLLMRVLQCATDGPVLAATAAVSATMFIHARALPLVAAWVLVVITDRFRDRPRFQLFLVLGTATTAAAFHSLGRWLTNYERETALAPLTHENVGALFSDLVSVRALLVLPLNALGQVMYLLMATLGVLLIGIIALSKLARSDDMPQRRAARFVLLTLGLSLALSVLLTNQGQGDLALFGRYTEVTIAVPLLLGFGAVLEAPLPLWFRNRAVPGLVLLVCFVVGARGYDAFGGRSQLLNISGTAFASRLVAHLDPVAYVLLIGIAMLALHFASQRHQLAAVAVIVLFFGANAFVLYDNARVFSQRASTHLTLLDDIGVLDAKACVALDQSGLTDFFSQENYRINDLERDYLFWSSDENGEVPCNQLVISENPALAERLPGWQPVAIEPERRQWLWASPAVAQRFDDQLIRPLPGIALSSPSADVRIELATSEADLDNPVEVEVTITNTSRETYIPLGSVPEGTSGVSLGLEWRDPNNPSSRLHEPIRVRVPSLIRPGETVTVIGSLDVDVPRFTADQGPWLVRAELVQEFIQWFDQAGSATVAVEVVGEVER